MAVKTDEQYLVEGIKLADGWSIAPFHDNGWVVTVPDEYDVDLRFHRGMETLPKWMIDAVAAQLRRQVDAMDNRWVRVDHISADIYTKVSGGRTDFSRVHFHGDDDRSLSVIKMIVNSKELLNGVQA